MTAQVTDQAFITAIVSAAPAFNRKQITGLRHLLAPKMPTELIAPAVPLMQRGAATRKSLPVAA